MIKIGKITTFKRDIQFNDIREKVAVRYPQGPLSPRVAVPNDRLRVISAADSGKIVHFRKEA